MTHAPGDLPHLATQSTVPIVPGRSFHSGGVIRPPETQAVVLGVPQSSRAWRVVRMILGVLGIVALVEAIIVMTFAFALAGTLAAKLHDATTPAPAVTGCPFGPDNCGG